MCYKPYAENSVDGLIFNGWRRGFVDGIYISESATSLLTACTQLAPRICNHGDIGNERRKNGYTSFTMCCDRLAAFVGYLPEENARGNVNYREYKDNAESERNRVVLITPDNDGLSFFWRLMSYDPTTKIMHDKPVMVGGLIFHREYVKHGEEHTANGLRGNWAMHT